MWSPVTSNGPAPKALIGRGIPPPRVDNRGRIGLQQPQTGFITEAAGFTVPASYLVKELGPPAYEFTGLYLR